MLLSLILFSPSISSLITHRSFIQMLLIQDIKDMLASRNFSLQLTLREGNQCVDYLAKLEAS